MNVNTSLLYSVLRFLFVIVCVIFGLISIYYIFTITYPFLIALLIALLINPLVNFLQRKAKIPRAISIIFAMVLVVAIFAGLITLLVAEIISGSNYLARVVPGHFESLVVYVEQFFLLQIMPIYNQLASFFTSLDTGQQTTIMDNIQNIGSKIAATVGTMIEKVLRAIPNIFAWLPNFATVLVFSFLATFFISKDWDKYSSIVTSRLPQAVHSKSIIVFQNLKKALVGFIVAQAKLISITGVIVLIGLLILRVEYAVTIAIIIGLVDLLPYLGTGLIFVPWIIYTFFTDQMGLGIGLTVLYIVVIVQRQVMEPKILSSSIGIDPLATLISLFVGFKLFGFLGLIIGPVTVVILKTLHQANVFQDIWSFIVGKNSGN